LQFSTKIGSGMTTNLKIIAQFLGSVDALACCSAAM
jgi:hypothetical protein